LYAKTSYFNLGAKSELGTTQQIDNVLVGLSGNSPTEPETPKQGVGGLPFVKQKKIAHHYFMKGKLFMCIYR